MNLLLDSQILIWHIYAPEKLSRRSSGLLVEDRSNLYVSHASIWELMNKIGRGRLLLAGTSPDDIIADIRNLGATILAITEPDILLAASLFHHHSDPFDRMLVAQAIRHNLTILSSDPVLPRYDVEVIPN